MTMQICSKQFVPSKSIVLVLSLLLAFSLLAQVGFGQAQIVQLPGFKHAGCGYNSVSVHGAASYANTCAEALELSCSSISSIPRPSHACPAECPRRIDISRQESSTGPCVPDELGRPGLFSDVCTLTEEFNCLYPLMPTPEPSVIDKIIDWIKGLFLIDMKIDWEGGLGFIGIGPAASSTASKTTTETIERTANAVLLITRECKSGGTPPCPKKDEVTKFVKNPLGPSTSPQVYRVEGNPGDRFRITLETGGESYSADGQVSQDRIGTFVICSEGERISLCSITIPFTADPVQVTYQPINEDGAPDGESSTTSLSTLATDASGNLVSLSDDPTAPRLIIDKHSGVAATDAEGIQSTFSTFYEIDQDGNQHQLAYIRAEDLAVYLSIAFKAPEGSETTATFKPSDRSGYSVAEVPQSILSSEAQVFQVIATRKDGSKKETSFRTPNGWFVSLGGETSKQRQEKANQAFAASLPSPEECIDQKITVQTTETTAITNLGELGQIVENIVTKEVLGVETSPTKPCGDLACGQSRTYERGDEIVTETCSSIQTEVAQTVQGDSGTPTA